MIPVKALVLTGFGLNCDYETDYALKLAGAESHRIHINQVIHGDRWGSKVRLEDHHILVFGGGFSWADDHGAGVLLASKIGFNLRDELDRFIRSGKLVIGICNGFQAIVNLGLLPGFEGNYQERRIALIPNAAGNFINAWVGLKINPDSPCVFTKGMKEIELPVRHGEGNFYALDQDMESLFKNKQVVAQYADSSGNPANGQWPANPNGSLRGHCRHLRSHRPHLRADAPPRGFQPCDKPSGLDPAEGNPPPPGRTFRSNRGRRRTHFSECGGLC